ncbi:MAG TPA: DUF3187 family protein [Planctomycetota bacterium]|nr:DUF3187 family protein [Planctomycetota bacterium]
MRRASLPLLRIGALIASFTAPVVAQEAPPVDESPWLRRENVGYGPFSAVSLSPLSSLRPGFLPVVPTSLTSGALEARVEQSWEKVISSSDSWFFDYEVLRSNLAVSWEPVDLLRLGFEFDSTERVGGGLLQHFMLAFHRAFGLKTSYITPYPAHENLIEIPAAPGRPAILVRGNDPEPFQSSGRLTLERELSYGDASLPAVGAAVSLGRKVVSGDLRQGLPVDVAGSLGASKGLGEVFLYAAADLEWFGDQSFFGLPLRATQWSVRAAVEWHCLPGFSLTAQYLLKRGAASRLEDFSLCSNDVSGGFTWELAPGVRLELALLHDLVNTYNTPDYGFHLGLALRW